MTTRRSFKYVGNAGRRNVAKTIASAHSDSSPPSMAFVDYVVQRVVTDRKAVRDPARRRLEAALRAGTIVSTFRDPVVAPVHLFEAAVRDLAARARSGWVAACAAVASLEPQALVEAMVAHAAPSDGGSGDSSVTPEAPVADNPVGVSPDTGHIHLREACRVAVEVLGADELRAIVAATTVPAPARPTRATVARRTRAVTLRQPEGFADPIDDAPATTTDAPCALLPDVSVEAVDAVVDGAIDHTLEEVPATAAVPDGYLEDGLALLLAARKGLRTYGITLPLSFDASRCDATARARAVCALNSLLETIDTAASDRSTQHRVARAYEALAKTVRAGRNPEAPSKRGRRSVAPPLNLSAFLAERAAHVTMPVRPPHTIDAGGSPNGTTDGDATPSNLRHLPVPLAPELQVVRRLFRVGDFHGAEVALGVVEVADHAALVALAQAMQARLNLEFDRAVKLAAQASQHAGDPVGPVAQAACALEMECAKGMPTDDGDQWDAWQASQAASSVRIADVYWQADLLARRDAHVEVVARLTAVIDTALRWMVGREFGLDLLKADREATGLWDALERRPEVFDVAVGALEQTFPRVSEETFRYIEGLVAVVRGLASEAAPHDATRAGRLRSIFTRIDNLRVVREMRHRSFLGHRPNRVSTAEMTWAAKRALSITSVAAETRPADMLLGSVAQMLRDMEIPLATANPLLRWGERLGHLVGPKSCPRTSRVRA